MYLLPIFDNKETYYSIGAETRMQKRCILKTISLFRPLIVLHLGWDTSARTTCSFMQTIMVLIEATRMCLVPLTDHCDKHCVDSHIVEELHRRSADLAAQIQKISWSLFTIKDEIDYPNVTAYCSCSEESKRSG